MSSGLFIYVSLSYHRHHHHEIFSTSITIRPQVHYVVSVNALKELLTYLLT